jgi:putative tryptophan/tyrosine transport system substrate-binding protein
MRCPRTRPLSGLSFVVVAFLCASACAPGDDRPEKVIAYINDDNPAGRRLKEKLDAALQRELSSRYRVRMRHVVANMSDPADMRVATLASVQMRPAAIVATNSETAAIAKSMTRDIPVIFGSQQDPIRMGLVESLARPGGNVTGFTYFVPIEQKRLELLRQLSPRVRKLGILFDRWWMEESEGSKVMEGCARQGFEPHVFLAETTDALQTTLATAAARQMDAWYVPFTVLPFDQPAELVSILEAMRKPVVYPATQFVERGGLISYQQLLPLEESSRLIANMVALVLDGLPAGEIPIERPKSFELAINLATAKRLGISVPRPLIKRADRVIGAEDAE